MLFKTVLYLFLIIRETVKEITVTQDNVKYDKFDIVT